MRILIKLFVLVNIVQIKIDCGNSNIQTLDNLPNKADEMIQH